MQSMAVSLSDALGRTSEGDSELAQARHGLSVAQRKLLSQLGTTNDLDTVAREFGWDADYANRTATRLVELGLVERKAVAAPEAPEADFSGARVLSIERGAPQSRKHWPILVALAVLGGIAAFWFSRSATAPVDAPAAPATESKPAAKAAAQAGEQKAPVVLPGAVYSMTLRETQAAAAPAQAPTSAPAPALAAAAKPAAATPQVATRGLTPATATAATAKAPAATPSAPAQAKAAAPEETKATPVVAEPVAPKTLVASAAPSGAETAKPSAPAAVEKALKVLTREAPAFPREAIQANVDRGAVKARMTVDGNGNVVKVDILEAQPRRVFDREVQRTLTRWKFEATGKTQTADTEVVFNRE